MMNNQIITANLIKSNKYSPSQEEAFDEDMVGDENENILITNDLNNELIFSNIPSTQLNIPKLSQTMNSCADSASSASSSSSSSISSSSNQALLNLNLNYADNYNKEYISKLDEFEILRSIQNAMYKYKWSTKFIRTELTSILIECESCEFSLNISNLIRKFKTKLDDINLAQTSSSSPVKCLNELINYYLIKLINVSFLKHDCKSNDPVLLLIKNFFRQFNKIDLDENNVDQVNLNESSLKQSILYKLKRQLNGYFNSLDLTNLELDSVEKSSYDSTQEVIDCPLNEDDTLLVNLESFDDFDLNNKSKQICSNGSNENMLLPTDNQIQFNNIDDNNNDKPNLGNQSSYDGSLSCDDNSFILKAINKRKLHLSCPICNSSVVNMSDHLVKKHSIRDRNQRKYIMDIVRKNYINESKITLSIQKDNSKQYSSNKYSSNKHSVKNSNSIEKDSTDIQTTRKFIKCPICLDDNKYFVNISDHLIKIHHLVTSETRKPILRQIKEKSSNYCVNTTKPQFDSTTPPYRDANFQIESKSNQQENTSVKQAIYPDFNFMKDVFNEKLENDSDQLTINDIFNEQAQTQTINKALSKRKPLKSKRFTGNFQPFDQNDLDDDNELIRNDSSSSSLEKLEVDENVKNCGADDDSDYSGLIALNYDSFDKNSNHNDKNDTENFIQRVDLTTNNKFQTNETVFESEYNNKRKSNEQFYDDDDLNNPASFDENQNCLINISDDQSSVSSKSKKIKYSMNTTNKSQESSSCDLLILNENVENYSVTNGITDKYSDNRYDNLNYTNVSILKTHTQPNSIYSLNTASPKVADTIDKHESTSNNIDQIMFKINSIESSIVKSYKSFELFTDTISKQIQHFSTQFQTTLVELDSLKKSLLIASLASNSSSEEQSLVFDSKKVAIKKTFNSLN